VSGRRSYQLAAAALASAALAAGVLVASGTGSTARTWTWEEAVPGDPVAGGKPSERLLVAEGDFGLLAASEEGTLEVGAGAGDDVTLQPLAALAGDDPLVAFAATTPEGGPQQLVGVARSDVEHVEAVLRDGTTVELPLNEWRAFSYTAPTSSETAIGLLSRSADGALGVVRVPQTTGVTQQAPAPSAYTISNRGHLVPPRPSRGTQDRLLGGHSYKLYLLATRNGRAFYRVQVTPRFTCWAAGKASRVGELGLLGCPSLVGAYPLQFEDVAYGGHGPSSRPEILRAGGIAADQAAAVALLDRSGRQVALAPVVDNVYSFPGPFPNSAGFARVALDAAGNRLEARLGDRHQTPPPGIFGPRATRVDPARLRAVVQRGSSEGVSVSIGKNATVVFDAGELAAATRKALRGDKAGFHCFVVARQIIRETRGTWIYARWRPPIAFRVVGIATPFDGCDIQGTYGHHWRDGRGTHSLVEIPFTDRGRRYFADRATARDLALFVRSRTTKELRKLTGPRLIAALRREYGDRIIVLPRCDSAPPLGVVGAHTSGARTVFSERSSTGDEFYVVLEQGKIVDENVRGLAFVF
jgi:hypothetical protein